MTVDSVLEVADAEGAEEFIDAIPKSSKDSIPEPSNEPTTTPVPEPSKDSIIPSMVRSVKEFTKALTVLPTKSPTAPQPDSREESSTSKPELHETLKFSKEVDDLVVKYMELLDEYTQLRAELNLTHITGYRKIATANFHADRGMRFGQEYYDERIQAETLCRITVPAQPEGSPEHSTTASTAATLSTFTAHEDVRPTSDGSGSQQVEEKEVDGKLKQNEVQGETSTETRRNSTAQTWATDETSHSTEQAIKNSNHNPIRMFGILVPLALREAQTYMVYSVMELVPTLLNLDSQLKELEIQIRRGRKHKLKAEKQAVMSGGLKINDGPEKQEVSGPSVEHGTPCDGLIESQMVKGDYDLQRYLAGYLSISLRTAIFDASRSRSMSYLDLNTGALKRSVRDLDRQMNEFLASRMRGRDERLTIMHQKITEHLDRIGDLYAHLPAGDRGIDLAQTVTEITECEWKLWDFKRTCINAQMGSDMREAQARSERTVCFCILQDTADRHYSRGSEVLHRRSPALASFLHEKLSSMSSLSCF